MEANGALSSTCIGHVIMIRASSRLWILFLLTFIGGNSALGAGAPTMVRFSFYTALSSNSELAHRFLTPLTAASVPARLAAMGKQLSDQPIDLSEERFLLYVPGGVPVSGYGLLVFIPPWDEARLPEGWDDVLDRYGLIFVSASRSGNDQTDLGRREPLAILAEQNVAREFRLDRTRIFIAGFSGGAHVAMRLALAYPDVFRGAILDAGSDPIGTAEVHIPAAELFHRFQESSRLVYLTGARDVTRLEMDATSIRSMRDWCQNNIDEIRPDSDHTVADPRALARAIEALLAPIEPDAAGLAACRRAVEGRLSAELDQLRALRTAGKADEASALLKRIDSRFGGLAASETVGSQP